MEGTNRQFDRLLFLYSSVTSAQNSKERKKRTVIYPNNSSAIRPVLHTEDLSVPVLLQQYILDSDDEPTGNQERHLIIIVNIKDWTSCLTQATFSTQCTHLATRLSSITTATTGQTTIGS